MKNIQDDNKRLKEYIKYGLERKAKQDSNEYVRLEAHKYFGVTDEAKSDEDKYVRMFWYDTFGYGEEALIDKSSLIRQFAKEYVLDELKIKLKLLECSGCLRLARAYELKNILIFTTKNGNKR